eukprot:284816629_3
MIIFAAETGPRLFELFGPARFLLLLFFALVTNEAERVAARDFLTRLLRGLVGGGNNNKYDTENTSATTADDVNFHELHVYTRSHIPTSSNVPNLHAIIPSCSCSRLSHLPHCDVLPRHTEAPSAVVTQDNGAVVDPTGRAKCRLIRLPLWKKQIAVWESYAVKKRKNIGRSSIAYLQRRREKWAGDLLRPQEMRNGRILTLEGTDRLKDLSRHCGGFSLFSPELKKYAMLGPQKIFLIISSQVKWDNQDENCDWDIRDGGGKSPEIEKLPSGLPDWCSVCDTLRTQFDPISQMSQQELEEYRQRQRDAFLKRKREKEEGNSSAQFSEPANLPRSKTPATATRTTAHPELCFGGSQRLGYDSHVSSSVKNVLDAAAPPAQNQDPATSSQYKAGGRSLISSDLSRPSSPSRRPIVVPDTSSDELLAKALAEELSRETPSRPNEDMDEASAAMISRLVAEDETTRPPDSQFQEQLISPGTYSNSSKCFLWVLFHTPQPYGEFFNGFIRSSTRHALIFLYFSWCIFCCLHCHCLLLPVPTSPLYSHPVESDVDIARRLQEEEFLRDAPSPAGDDVIFPPRLAQQPLTTPLRHDTARTAASKIQPAATPSLPLAPPARCLRQKKHLAGGGDADCDRSPALTVSRQPNLSGSPVALSRETECRERPVCS